MGFDDLARRMEARRDGESPPAPSSTLGATPSQDQILAEYARSEARSKATGDIVLGAILVIVGIAITSFTYDSASREGGTYVVAYGPIIYGAIRLIRGLARRASA